MRVNCPHCSRSLEFNGPPPSYCGYCGKPLPKSALDETAAFEPTAAFDDFGSPNEIPVSVGDYKVIRVLGDGGMGVVYEGESPDGRRVAVKLMRPEAERSSTGEERFRQEGRLASGIAHPRCVFVLGADYEADRPYIVMELMSGETLKDLVERAGPLEPLDAVAKILDVVDGLREAHALGVVHRDVKPSNCFLESDGRVKVGDFGLSRSLAAPSHLTQTGGFLGTVLFAAPEQHKAEAVDARTDVYSVCATLFYLLIGRAPFQDAHASAAVARIVTEPAPSPRKLRADVPKLLERIVLKGLERSPERRFQSLDELRTELSLLLPERLSFAGMATRAGAYLFDAVMVQLAMLALTVVVASMPWLGISEIIEPVSVVLRTLAVAIYFWVLESIWGASLGKRLVRLRVSSAAGLQTPSWRSVLLRSIVFCFLFEGFADVVTTQLTPTLSASANTGVYFAVWIGGFLTLLSTMRPRNGYRMLHEVLTDTKVVQLPWPQAKANLKGRRIEEREVSCASKDAPATIGRFAIRGALRQDKEGSLFLVEDSELDRRAILWLRSEPPLSENRRRVVRAGRLRWLDGGTHEDKIWDAFLAPRGSPLTEVVGESGRLDWATTRPMLELLAEELQVAEQDGTSLKRLSAADVWLQPDGGVQLCDWPLEPASTTADSSSSSKEQSPLEALREVAVLALEGRARSSGAADHPIRAVAPLHARSMLNRLLEAKEPALSSLSADKRNDDSISSFRSDLAKTRNLPVRVDLSLRALQISLMSIGLVLLIVAMLVVTRARSYQRLTRLEHIDSEQVWRRVLGPVGVRFAVFDHLPIDHPLRANPKRLEAIADRRSKEDRRRLATLRANLGPLGKSLILARSLLESDTDSKSTASDDRVIHAPSVDEPTLFVSLASPSGNIHHYAYKVGINDIERMNWSEGPYGADPDDATGDAVGMVALLWLLWMAWGFVVRGGASYRLAGLTLVRSDGRKALRFQVLWRAFLYWIPLLATVVAAFWIDAYHPELVWLCEVLNWATLVLLAGYALSVILSPARTLHDQFSGIYLVPR